jgi:hypothetical protein
LIGILGFTLLAGVETHRPWDKRKSNIMRKTGPAVVTKTDRPLLNKLCESLWEILCWLGGLFLIEAKVGLEGIGAAVEILGFELTANFLYSKVYPRTRFKRFVLLSRNRKRYRLRLYFSKSFDSGFRIQETLDEDSNYPNGLVVDISILGLTLDVGIKNLKRRYR